MDQDDTQVQKKLKNYNIGKKACLVKEHTDDSLILVCTKADCEYESQTICMDCIEDDYHQHGKDTIKAIDIINSEDIIMRKWPKDQKIKKIQQYLDDDIDNKMLQQFEQKLDKMVQNFGLQIEKIKKDIKIKVLEGTNITKQNLNKLSKEIQIALDIKPLQQGCCQFLKGQTDLQDLNKQIKEFSQIQEINCKNIMQQYNKFIQNEQIFIYDWDLVLQDLQKVEQNLNKYCFSQISQIIQSEKLVQFQFSPMEYNEENCEILGDNQYKGLDKGKNIFVSNQILNTEDTIKLRFQIQEFDRGCFFFGVKSLKDFKQDLYFSSGNQICITHEGQHYRKPFEHFNDQRKSFEDVFSIGQIYECEICIKDDLLIVSDLDKQCVMKSSVGYEKNLDDWVVIFGANCCNRPYQIQFQSIL